MHNTLRRKDSHTHKDTFSYDFDHGIYLFLVVFKGYRSIQMDQYKCIATDGKIPPSPPSPNTDLQSNGKL